MSRFYYHPEINQSTILALSHEESLHLKTNRIQPETEILLSDGLGSLYSGIFKGFVIAQKLLDRWMAYNTRIEKEWHSKYQLLLSVE
jgi:16S rRNA U1498 N3-methylase RsmE